MFYCTLKGKEFAHIKLEKVENPRGVSGSGNGDAQRTLEQVKGVHCLFL